jgi:hypothetical protein
MQNKTSNSLLIHKSILIFVILFVLLGFTFNVGFVGQIIGTLAGVSSAMLVISALLVGMSIADYRKFLVISIVVSIFVVAYTDYQAAEWVEKIGIVRDSKYYTHLIWTKVTAFLIIAHLFNFIKIKFNIKI